MLILLIKQNLSDVCFATNSIKRSYASIKLVVTCNLSSYLSRFSTLYNASVIYPGQQDLITSSLPNNNTPARLYPWIPDEKSFSHNPALFIISSSDILSHWWSGFLLLAKFLTLSIKSIRRSSLVTYGKILCSAYVLLFLLYIFCNWGSI